MSEAVSGLPEKMYYNPLSDNWITNQLSYIICATQQSWLYNFIV